MVKNLFCDGQLRIYNTDIVIACCRWYSQMLFSICNSVPWGNNNYYSAYCHPAPT